MCLLHQRDETRIAGGDEGLRQVRCWPGPLKRSLGFMLEDQRDYSVMADTFLPHFGLLLQDWHLTVLTEQRRRLRLCGASRLAPLLT